MRAKITTTLIAFLGLGMILPLAACTVTRTDQENSPGGKGSAETASGGIAPDTDPHYYLPTGHIDLQVTRVLACEKDTRVASVGWTVTASVNTIADTQNPVPLKLSELEHFGRDVAATIKFAEDGRLTAVNVDSKDQIGPTIANTIGGLAKIALAVTSIAANALELQPKIDDNRRVLCRTNVADIFDAARSLQAQANAALRKRAKIASGLANTEPGSPAHAGITKELAAIDKGISSYKKELVKLLEPYTYTASLSVAPVMSKQPHTTPIKAIPEKVVSRWLGGGAEKLPTQGTLTIAPEGDWAKQPDTFDGTKLYVRMPGTVKAQVIAECVLARAQPPDGICRPYSESPYLGAAIVFDKSLSLPQAGRLLAVDLDAKVFRDKLVNIEFYANGSLKSYGTTQKSGLQATGNLISGIQQSTDAYAAFRAEREAKRSDINELKDENTLLEAQIKNLENKKKLAALLAEEQVSDN